MNITENFITGSLQYLQFPENNTIRFGMDHGVWQGVPSDVKFFPVKELSNGLIDMVGDGYGILPHHRLSGNYGGGSIAVFMQDLPKETIEWCKNNFLKMKNEKIHAGVHQLSEA